MTKRKVPNDEILKDLYLNKRLSSGMIAEKYDCARGSVCRHLRRLGIVRPEEGVNSRNRNFHKKQYRSGYPVTFLPNHARASHIGYVYDHVLIMEKEIGRTPSRKEPIHHIDFDRGNMDISNLYLCKSRREHSLIHKSLEDVAKKLYHDGFIMFKDGKYCLTKELEAEHHE